MDPTDASSTTGIDPRDLRPGQVIDGYRLVERAHQGGMATLWNVLDERPNGRSGSKTPLIMKVPRYKGGEDPAAIVGFEVESMIMPMLSGPHVPCFVAKGDFTRLPYIVMEQIPGTSLRSRFDESPLDVDEIVELGSRVATALHDLHRQRVVHLDVKPSNVLMRADGTAVLIDFGLSRHEQLPDLLEEQFRLPMGTGPYMSPEQVQFVRNDPRSDIFALGVMLYHFTTGHRPFGAPTSIGGLRKRLHVEPAPPRALRPDCPPWLQEVILKCLEVKASARYASAAQLALAFQDPAQIPLTARARKHTRSGAFTRLRRWFHALGGEPETSVTAVSSQLSSARIVVVALDIEGGAPDLLERLREASRALLTLQTGARLACVSVMRTARLGMDERTDEQGRSVHVRQLVQLRHWARPISRGLAMEEGRLTFHVLEAPDAAPAIIEFSRRLRADHIVIGARGTSRLRRFLGSVSSEVVAQAECTVTVVRVPLAAAADPEGLVGSAQG